MVRRLEAAIVLSVMTLGAGSGALMAGPGSAPADGHDVWVVDRYLPAQRVIIVGGRDIPLAMSAAESLDLQLKNIGWTGGDFAAVIKFSADGGRGSIISNIQVLR